MKKKLLPKTLVSKINQQENEEFHSLVDNVDSSNSGLVSKLKQAMETAEERGKVYGPSHRNYEHNARILMSMYPEGIELKTFEDFSRFIIMTMISVKLCRYVNNWSKGGHQDSIHDLGVYSFILEDFDERCSNNRE